MATNPFDQFDAPANAATTLGRPVIRKGAATPSPTEVYHPMTPQQRTDYGIPSSVPVIINESGKPEIINTGGGADKTSYSPMSHDAKVAAGIDPALPFYISSNGLPTLPTGAKGGAAPVDTEQARSHVSTILQSIDHATSLLDQPLTSGLAGSIFGHIPGTNAYVLRSLVGDTTDPSNPGQITGDLRQQGIAYLRTLNGGNGVGTVARSQQEQAALQSAMSNIRQGLPPDQLKEALGNVKQIYLRAFARSYGSDPEDPAVQKRFGIDPLYQLPGDSALPPVPKSVNGVTLSNPPPAITASGDATGISSGDVQSITDPKMAAIAPMLEHYLAADPKKVTNGMILGFMQKNGVDPTSTTILPVLQYRMSKDGAAWRAQGGNYGVDPRRNVPLTGAAKVGATITGASPALTAGVAGAADAGSLGAIPDAAGIIHAITGMGPSRADAINARDTLAGAEPGATLAGNLLGGFLTLPGAGEASALARTGRVAGQGGLYGFLGSEDPNIESRLFNGAVGSAVGAVAHGATDVAGRMGQSGYRAAAKPIESLLVGTEKTGDKYALNAAARAMPTQNVEGVKIADAAANSAGVPAPAAASINRGGQDYLARAAAGSPGARAVADEVAAHTRAAIPQQLAQDFNDAIEAVAPRGVSSSAYLNRPVREIASDVQGMAGREFERGIEPIKNERMTITPEVAGDLDHERVAGAIRDALANHSLSDATRNELRTLLPNVKTLANAPGIARQAYAKGIPLSVDGARNIATALDRTAGKLMDGSEGQVEMSRLSKGIRGAIAEQFPEYGPVNARYASRMRAKEAMFEARRNFMASTPDQADALARAGKRFTNEANAPEFGAASQTGPNGFKQPVPPLPSNRQFAMTGAREAATVKAGETGAGAVDRLANSPNQAANNKIVMGNEGAASVAAKAGQRTKNIQAVDRVANSGTADQTEGWFNKVKQVAAMKMTGGASHYALAHAAASVPGLSSADAARVVRLYLDADAAPQVLQSLTKAYGARRARFVMARMAAVTSAATAVRGFPQKPAVAPSSAP